MLYLKCEGKRLSHGWYIRVDLNAPLTFNNEMNPRENAQVAKLHFSLHWESDQM